MYTHTHTDVSEFLKFIVQYYMTMFISEAVLEAKPSGTFQDNTGTFW